jgi:hypothetical protein
MLSFNESIELKKSCLDALKAIPVEPDRWSSKTLFWDGTVGSFSGHLIQSEDVNEFTALGLPKWLALTLDYLFSAHQSLELAVENCLSILDSIPVGVDLSLIGSQYLLALMDDPEHGIAHLVHHEKSTEAISSVRIFHEQLLAKQEPDSAAWRQLRKELLSYTDQCIDESLEALLCIFAEACAWHPEKSRTTISDALRCWGRVQGEVLKSPNWSLEQDQRIRRLLNELYQEEKAKQAPDQNEFIDVFLLLEKAYPEDSDWVKAQIS